MLKPQPKKLIEGVSKITRAHKPKVFKAPIPYSPRHKPHSGKNWGKRSSIGKLFLALDAIEKHSEGKAIKGKRGFAASIKCPCCPKGLLNYSIARSNGHTAAGCTTTGCVRFIQ